MFDVKLPVAEIANRLTLAGIEVRAPMSSAPIGKVLLSAKFWK